MKYTYIQEDSEIEGWMFILMKQASLKLSNSVFVLLFLFKFRIVRSSNGIARVLKCYFYKRHSKTRKGIFVTLCVCGQ